MIVVCFFFSDTATTEIYTLPLHDALPIWPSRWIRSGIRPQSRRGPANIAQRQGHSGVVGLSRPTRDHRMILRSEEHTSELQSRQYLACRLLLEKTTANFADAISHVGAVAR